MTVAAVVLAAGRASRFAGPQSKLLSAFRGWPRVCWPVLAAASCGCDEVVVVNGASDLTTTVSLWGHPAPESRLARAPSNLSSGGTRLVRCPRA